MKSAPRLTAALPVFALVLAAAPAPGAGAEAGATPAAGAAAAAAAVSTGSVTGVVELGGKAQRPRLSKRYKRGAGGPPPAEAEPVAVVYLLRPGGGAIAAPPAPATAEPYELAQKGLQFKPAVLPVQVGAKVRFPNKDSTYHNVFSYSPTKKFDLGRYLNEDKVPEVTFEEPGTVQVYCEIHNHMKATILVLETPYFTTSDEKGGFELSGVPPGDYQLVAWLSDKQVRQRNITVTAGGTVSLTVAGKD